MSIQEVKGKGNIPEFQNTKKSGQAEGFQESLMQNLKCQNQEDEDITSAEKKVRKTDEPGVNVMGGLSGVRVNAAALTKAMQTAEVRHMSYEESDNVEIAVAEGYALKGKILPQTSDTDAGPTGGRQVYVEAKYEDGRLEAYQVNTAVISEQTEHRIERFALNTVSGS